MKYQIVSERKLRRKVKIENPDEVYKLVKRYAESKQEHFILLTLNGEHNVISVSIVSIGLVNKTGVHPREVYCRAISDRATAIIVCHNHPSGTAEPSEEDKDVTLGLYEAGEIIEIPLIDHIVFTKTGYTSLKKDGFFPKKK
jgi:DNA repair protein RadC